MNKYSKLFLGLSTLVLAASCASDEPGVNGPTENKPAGDMAYMAVRIKAASDTRSTTDGGFQDSNLAAEHEVLGAKFYFFDENGNFVMDASVYDPAPDTIPVTTDNPDNIEFNTNSILVLDQLTDKGYPKYMMTVLNAPNFEVQSTMQATAEKLYNYNDTTDAGKKYFVMTTSSYLGGTDTHHSDDAYYVTTLNDDDFYTSADAAKADNQAVEVYVERLAAKVGVTINEDNKFKKLADGRVLYKLDASVAGTGNGDENDSPAATTNLYVYVENWGLNATSNKSYMSKQLDSITWKTTAPFTNWNDATRFRSYWGKGTSYGATPSIGTGDTHISYKTVADLGNAALNDVFEYCNENTNDAVTGHIFSANSAGTVLVDSRYATHAVIHAVVCDSTGNSIDLINYKGLYYTNEAFKNYILQNIKNGSTKLNYWVKTSSETTEGGATTNEYRQIGTNDLIFVQPEGYKLGECDMVLNLPEGTVIYAKGKDAEGNDKWEPIEGGLAELKDLVKVTKVTKATDGHTVYYVPIEHLAADANAQSKQIEGYYGVVRNHWYNLTLNSFKKVGHGIFDPENGSETIEPNGPEDPLYYVGARINILNWRIVNQSVDL